MEEAELAGSLTETHNFNTRGLPTEVKVTTSSENVLDWLYSTDAVGNVTGITQTVPSGVAPRTYGYRDFQYFLTQGDGPWGTRSWTYDRVGNRLSETSSGVTDTYSYVPNGTGGDTALLASVSLGGGGARDYLFGPAGHLDAVASSGNQVLFTHDATGQLSRLERPSAGASTDLLYDGRGYLNLSTGELPPALLVEHDEPAARTASDVAPRGTPGTPLFADGFEDGTVCAWTTTAGDVTPPPTACPKPQLLTAAATYSSSGVLHHLHTDTPADGERELFYFYFQGRPVAQLERVADTDTYHWIATDHLGTPIGLVERNSQTTVLLWHGGFEPFGEDFSGASTAGVPLRFPGQWTDASWESAAAGADVYYNVNRWYESGTGRYERADPLGVSAGSRMKQAVNAFVFVDGQPLRSMDPLGLFKLDDSCNCLITRDSGTTSPSKNQFTYLVRSVRTACQARTAQITNAPLRRCIEKSCDVGRVVCRNDCPDGQLGGTTDVVGAHILGLFGGSIKEAKLCLNDWPALREADPGDVAVHEWAHGCRWLHGQGGGVPGDDGTF